MSTSIIPCGRAPRLGAATNGRLLLFTSAFSGLASQEEAVDRVEDQARKIATEIVLLPVLRLLLWTAASGSLFREILNVPASEGTQNSATNRKCLLLKFVGSSL